MELLSLHLIAAFYFNQKIDKTVMRMTNAPHFIIIMNVQNKNWKKNWKIAAAEILTRNEYTVKSIIIIYTFDLFVNNL